MPNTPQNPLQSPGNRQSVSAEHPNRFAPPKPKTCP